MAKLVLHPKLGLISGASSGHGLLHGFTHMLAVVGMNKVRPRFGVYDMLARNAAHQFPPPRRQVIVAGFQVPVPGTVAAAFQNERQALFRLAQRYFAQLALRDVQKTAVVADSSALVIGLTKSPHAVPLRLPVSVNAAFHFCG